MVLTFLATAAVGYSALCGLVYLQQDRLLYFPAAHLPATPSDFGLEFESFELDLAGSTVTGWLVRATDPDAPWLLHCHGNGGNIAYNISYLVLFQKLGCHGVIFDYRGYGKSQGVPSEAGLLEDARAVRDYLITRQGVGPERLILSGDSFQGGGA